MKPIRLELKEFGPYKNEVIEWDKIINEPMFLITGKTGSGKSTLFDAITYALYNKTTGGKDIASLRTKTADDKDRTTVIFDFELRGKFYRIERTLAYTKKGNKNQTSGKVVFMEIVGGNSEVLATKEQDVKEKVEEIIGLDDKQFCQIIILPQGKFKEFLLSKSSEKKETLRSLFNTYFYQNFVEKLTNYSKELDNEFKIKERELVTKFEQFDFDEDLIKFEFLKEDSFNEVDEQLSKQEVDINNKETELGKYLLELEKLNNEFKELEKLNDKFINLENAQSEYLTLEKNKENIIKLKEVILKLEELEKSRDKILDYYKFIEKKDNLEKDKVILDNQYKVYKEEVVQKNKLLEEIDKSRKSIEKDKIKQQELVYFYNNIEEFNKAISDNKIYTKKLTDLSDDKEKLEIVTEKIKVSTETIEELNEEKNILDSSVGTVRLTKVKKEGEVEKLEDYNNLLQKFKDKKESVDKNNIELNELTKERLSLRKIIDKIEENKNQEVLNKYLEKLHEGDNCPLCEQKISHLPKAKKVLTEENIEVQNNYDEISEKVIKLEAFIEHENKILKNSELELLEKEATINKNSIAELQDILREEELEVKKLRDVEDHLLKAKDELNKLKENKKNLDDILIKEEEYKQIVLLSKAKVEEYNKNIKLDIAEFKEFYEKLLFRIQDFDKKEQDFKNKKEELSVKEKELTIEQKNIDNRLEETLSDINDILEKFENSTLKKYYSNIVTAKDELESTSQLEVYRSEVENYEYKIKLQQETISKLQKELEDKKRPNLAEYSEVIAEKTKEVDSYKERLVVLKNKYKANKKLSSKLYEEFTKWEKYTNVAREVLALNNVLSGKAESRKSLETYVQGYYLDLILEAGSRRLLKMSNGRYQFERRLEKSKGGGLQGLDIEIYDVYLNSSRMVSSLSGGELFLASLSLALGLAEVIQNESGGISLETIFIDEGFGSLDAETLDIAITTLIDLQSYGRNIGIISHVSELKDRVRAKIEVYSENNYSKVRIVGV